MQGKSITKVPGGKLLKIYLEYNKKINKISITGDFFMHPEESLEKLEQELVGLDLDRDLLLEKINIFLKKKNVKLFGIESKDIVECIMDCLSDG